MATTDPTPDEVEQVIAELLREQELGALATLSPTGAPSVSMMHVASDGLTVYLHTFTYNRKFAAIQRDPRVAYTVTCVPPGGFQERWQLRSVQVDGIATVVTDQAEIDRALQVSREQFAWLQTRHAPAPDAPHPVPGALPSPAHLETAREQQSHPPQPSV